MPFQTLVSTKQFPTWCGWLMLFTKLKKALQLGYVTHFLQVLFMKNLPI